MGEISPQISVVQNLHEKPIREINAIQHNPRLLTTSDIYRLTHLANEEYKLAIRVKRRNTWFTKSYRVLVSSGIMIL